MFWLTNLNLHHGLLGISAQLWPLLPQLSSESRDRWVYAEAQIHASMPLPAANRVAANSAIKEFGWILEREFTSRVFSPFRSVMRGDAQLMQKARADSNSFGRDEFLTYLVAKDRELSLGSMLGALKDCRNSVVPTHLEFREYVEARFPRLLSSLADVDIVKEHRNLASHTDRLFDKETALKVAAALKNSLDALVED